MDKAIRCTLQRRGNDSALESGHRTTPQDHFYKEISSIEEIIPCLQIVQDDVIISESPKEVVSTILSVNTVIISMLRDALNTRNRRLNDLLPPKEFTAQNRYEHLPWTCTPGPTGVRSALLAQYRATNEKALPLAEDASFRAAIVSQMVDLADLILDGYRTQFESVDATADPGRLDTIQKMMEKDRKALIMPFVEKGFHSEATSLAEKYLEFVALIAVCEAAGDRGRLDQYMERFADQRFSDFVFEWHLKEGRPDKLLSAVDSAKESRNRLETRRAQELDRFLKSGGHEGIQWLHEIGMGDFETAGETLAELGKEESRVLARKKTMLSLAKLAALASEADDAIISETVSEVDHHLNVVAAQEQLPKEIFKEKRVLTPQELVEFYTDEGLNRDADAVDFKRALDLIQYVPPSSALSHDDLRRRVWCRAVKRDDWTKLDVDNPVEAVAETVFFRLLEFCYLSDPARADILPNVDEILTASDELSRELRENSNFQFLLRSGWEHVARTVVAGGDAMETT